jgi:hypothetical protein
LDYWRIFSDKGKLLFKILQKKRQELNLYIYLKLVVVLRFIISLEILRRQQTQAYPESPMLQVDIRQIAGKEELIMTMRQLD